VSQFDEDTLHERDERRVIPVARDRHLEVRPRSLPVGVVVGCTVCVWVVRSEAIVYRGHVMRPPPWRGATDDAVAVASLLEPTAE